MKIGDPFQEVYHDGLGLFNVWKAAFLKISIKRERIELKNDIC